MSRMKFSFPAPPIPIREQGRVHFNEHTISAACSDRLEADVSPSRVQYHATKNLKQPTVCNLSADLMSLPVNLYHSNALEEIVRDWNPEFTTLVYIPTSKWKQHTEEEKVLPKECYRRMSGDAIGSLIRSMVPGGIRVGEFPVNSDIFSSIFVDHVKEDDIAEVTIIPHSTTGSSTRKRRVRHSGDFDEEMHFKPNVATVTPDRKVASNRRHIVNNSDLFVTDEERELVSILISHLGETNVDTTDLDWFDKVMSKANIALRGLDVMLNKAKSDSEKARSSNVFLRKKKKVLQTELYQSMVDISVIKQSRSMRSEGSFSLQLSNPVTLIRMPDTSELSAECSSNTYHSHNSSRQEVRQVPFVHRESRMPYAVDRRKRISRVPQLLPMVETDTGIGTNSLLHNSARYIEYTLPPKKPCFTGVFSNKSKFVDSTSQRDRINVEVITLD